MLKFKSKHKAAWLARILITMIVLMSFPMVTFAAAGEGTATIEKGTGGTGADDATYGAAADTQAVTVGTLTYLKINLTVGASHIAAAQDNVTVQIPTNLFADTSWDTNEEAALGDVDAAGEWFVDYDDTDAVTTDNTAISFAASDAVNTGLITIQADQQMDSTDIIILYAAVNDTNYVRAAQTATISTDDTGGTPSPIGASPTVSTTAGSIASASVAPQFLFTLTTGTATVTFTPTNAIPSDGTIRVVFDDDFTLSASATVSCSTMTGSFAASLATTTNANDTMVITRSGGSSNAGGAAETCTISNVGNPSAAQTTDTYSIITTLAAGVGQTVDSKTNVTGSAIASYATHNTSASDSGPVTTYYTGNDDTSDDTTTDDTTEDTTEDTSEDTGSETVTPTNSFSDMETHWAVDTVAAMVDEGIVKGNEDGTFKPDNNLTRAEAATLLFRVLGLSEPMAPTEKPFTDVAVDAWYAGYVNDLKALTYVTGYPDGTYRPGNAINRAEFLTLAMNVYLTLADEEEVDIVNGLVAVADLGYFADLKEGQWYAQTVAAAGFKGFVQGSACGESRCFNATTNITRAEATQILYNMFYALLTD